MSSLKTMNGRLYQNTAKTQIMKKHKPDHSKSDMWRGRICGCLDRAVFGLILFLLFFTPLFLIPRVGTYNTAVHVKQLFVGFTSSTAAMLFLVRLMICGGGNSSSKKADGRRTKPASTASSLPISFHHDPVRLAILVYALTIGLSALFSGEALYSLRHALRTWPILVIFLAMPRILPGAGKQGFLIQLDKIRYIILGAGALAGAYGLCQYFGFDFLHTWFAYDIKDKLARNEILSTIGNPEYLGSYMAPLALLCLPDVLAISQDNKGKKAGNFFRRTIGVILCLVFVSTLLLTGSRGAIIGLVGGALIAFLAILFRGKNWENTRFRDLFRGRFLVAIVVLAVFILAFVILFSFPNPLNIHNQAIVERFKNLFDIRSTSVKERILFYAIGAEMIKENPLCGVGEGMFRVKFYPTLIKLAERDDRIGVTRFIDELQNRVANDIHNDYLQVWVENGSLGFLAFSLAIALFIAETLSLLFKKQLPGAIMDRRHSRKDSGATLLAYKFTVFMAFTAATFCMLINASFSFPMHTPARSVLIWFLLGITHTAALTLHRINR